MTITAAGGAPRITIRSSVCDEVETALRASLTKLGKLKAQLPYTRTDLLAFVTDDSIRPEIREDLLPILVAHGIVPTGSNALTANSNALAFMIDPEIRSVIESNVREQLATLKFSQAGGTLAEVSGVLKDPDEYFRRFTVAYPRQGRVTPRDLMIRIHHAYDAFLSGIPPTLQPFPVIGFLEGGLQADSSIREMSVEALFEGVRVTIDPGVTVV